MNLKDHIRDIPDFPKSGILFRDITPLLQQPEAMAFIEDQFVEAVGAERITAIAGIESRGFIFGTALARRLELGFIPIRKPGKLPAASISESYSLEYGENVLELHEDAADKNDRVLIVDDLLATGGTAAASVKLVERLGATVAAVAFVVELSFLKGREQLAGHKVISLVDYTD